MVEVALADLLDGANPDGLDGQVSVDASDPARPS